MRPQMRPRARSSAVVRALFAFATVVTLASLTAVVAHVVNTAAGLVAVGGPDASDRSPIPDSPVATSDQTGEGEVIASWTLLESLVRRRQIEREVSALLPEGTRLEFRSWLSLSFVTRGYSPNPLRTGIRGALIGSVWMVAIAVVVAVPTGVAAAIYLEEFCPRDLLRKAMRESVHLLAGVPSVVYGLIGLVLFVRFLGPLTSGAAFGATATRVPTGRTIVSAGLTLALLTLPRIVIAAEQAINAVEPRVRLAAFSVGATRWQVVRDHVLPQAGPEIGAAAILAIARAVGDAAIVIMVGASTVVIADPGPFAAFTALPVVAYQWAMRPDASYRGLASAALLVLLLLVVVLNAAAAVARSRARRTR